MHGGVPERSKGADCKSAGEAYGGSNPPPSTITLLRWEIAIRDNGCRSLIISGSSSVARASAFQAEGRGFESRFPLQFVWQEALPVLYGSATDSAKVKIGRGAGCGCGEKAVSLDEDNRPT